MKYCNLLRVLIGYEVFRAALCNKPIESKKSTARHLVSGQECSNPLDKPSSTSGGSKYEQWVSSLSSPYQNFLYLPTTSNPCNGMALHWQIVPDVSRIQVAVAVKAGGWAAIGFSETGGMKGADILLFEASTNKLVDSYVGDGYMRPTRDKLSQDWSLRSSKVTDDGFIIFEAERDLVTSQEPGHEDHNIVDDSNIWVADHKIVGAWGDETTVSYHFKNVVQRSIQLFTEGNSDTNGDEKAIFKKEMDDRADGYAVLQLNNYYIPTAETTYKELCFSVNDLVDLGLYENTESSTHVIGFEFLLDENNVKYVHHMVVYGHFSNANSNTSSCQMWTRTPITAWAPGDDTNYFPDGSGLQVGNVGNSFNAITIQYHFNNVNGDKNNIDNGTGVKIYYTNKKSTIQNEIGMVVIGDGPVDLVGKSLGNGKTKHEISCPSQCTENTLAVDEVTVVSEAHHMHVKGKRSVNRLYSADGKTIINTATVDFWDFDQKGTKTVRQEPYQLKRGDFYSIACYYESYANVVWGPASSDEMCMAFVYYYPKQDDFFSCSPNDFKSVCRSTHTKTSLESGSNFDRAISATKAPTAEPTKIPTKTPTKIPTMEPTKITTKMPTTAPTKMPTKKPTNVSVVNPSNDSLPTGGSSNAPSKVPIAPSAPPVPAPVSAPSISILVTASPSNLDLDLSTENGSSGDSSSSPTTSFCILMQFTISIILLLANT